MTRLIVLKLDGTLEQGFRVTLEIGSEGKRPETEMIGNLPSDPELVIQYSHWQSTYRNLGKATRAIKAKEVTIDGTLKKLKQDCKTQADKLGSSFNKWLEAKSFFQLREKWLETVSTSEKVRVLIRADNQQIWQLPWHQWDLLERYNFAEIGFSTLGYEPPPKVQFPRHAKVRILAILGNSEGIKVEEDRKYLEHLPDAVTTFLVEPQRQELNSQLWAKSWDILFFAGHSRTEGEKGRIYLNQTDSLTLDELKHGLKQAVASGLRLAIFNSCDGLGLARELKQLHIPLIIVMREPVPDDVAQAFLKYFLQAFSSGVPLYLAVQKARKQLQGLEGEFPCASWLPVIYQNPAVLSWPPIWPEPRWRQWRTILTTSLIVTGLVMGVRSAPPLRSAQSQGLLEAWELKTYDLLLRQRPSESADSRLLLVGADEADLRQYKHPLSDAILTQLIAKLNQHQPIAIGLDIFRDQAVPPGHNLLVQQLQQNKRLVTVGTLGNNLGNAVAPPPNSPVKQVGFNDLLNDKDYIVRRHLQSRSSNPISPFLPCDTPYSFSLQLAYRYLEKEGIYRKITNKNWQFSNVVFKRLESHSGGYQNLDARGNQVLINYRATPQIAQRVTVKDVLSGKFNSSWVRNRVVLIGVTAASIQDNHETPYGRMRGLEVHAQMVSQILSAVLDKRPLIWWFPQWVDLLWVWGWSLIAGILVYEMRSLNIKRSRLHLVPVLAICITIVYGICWLFLLQGAWLPLIPTALALLLTGGAIAYIPYFTHKQQ